MPDGFSSLADIINNEPGLKGVRNIIKLSDVVNEFNNIFPELAKVAVAVKVDKKNVLFLRVENAAWRNELKFKEKIIVEKINKHFCEERIKAVKFYY